MGRAMSWNVDILLKVTLHFDLLESISRCRLISLEGWMVHDFSLNGFSLIYNCNMYITVSYFNFEFLRTIGNGDWEVLSFLLVSEEFMSLVAREGNFDLEWWMFLAA
jgi:hypothetical protein